LTRFGLFQLGKEKIMGSMSIWHWVIVLVVVVAIFGTAKLRNAGSDLGKAVKGFKDGVRGEDDERPVDPVNPVVPPQQVADKSTIDVEARDRTRH
jgi:sec-independent protein translocase protein TatA